MFFLDTGHTFVLSQSFADLQGFSGVSCVISSNRSEEDACGEVRLMSSLDKSTAFLCRVGTSADTLLFFTRFLCSFWHGSKRSAQTGRMECRGGNLLLLILSVAGMLYTVRSAKNRTLDMAPDAVDDVFSGCRDEMMQRVTAPGGFLDKECKANKKFAEMWRNHNRTCEKQINGTTPHHYVALQVYGNSGDKFRDMFNEKVQTKGSNSTTYLEEFPFKSLHFLLTDALRLLNPGKTCRTVYFGTGDHYTAEPGKEVRFGRFISGSVKKTSEEEKVVEESGGTLFLFNASCSVVNIEKYTCTSEEVEQLILPNEVFTVQSVETGRSEDVKYTAITLRHSCFQGTRDCYYIPSTGSSATPGGSSSALLMAFLLSVFFCTLTFI
ncbi:hypothetical protein NFI96_017020 [Prochilodus magdalenae]|nr:hypothetical protein NFI96_017020 [Prochilodus magdalenae]